MKTQPLQQWAARREYLKRLKRAFEEAGISIPFPHRLLVQDNAEPRTMPPAAAVPSSASKPA
jgi:small conductance mechanosensitive channel